MDPKQISEELARKMLDEKPAKTAPKKRVTRRKKSKKPSVKKG
jgi:hypothetical protein